MKVTFTNAEIENFLKIIGNPKSFRNNINIKIPFELDWALRINIKKLTDRYAILDDVRNDLNKSFIDSNKIEDDGKSIKKEYTEEYFASLHQIMNQKNEFEFETVNKDMLKNPSLDELSMPERDFLMTMVNKDE